MLETTPIIVAIDDSQLVLTQLKLLIENKTPCKFVGFDCGYKALESELIHNASLILLDMNMPSIDGVEMLRKLGELEVKQPLALLSGENSLFLKNAAALAGLHGLTIVSSIEKPLSATKLAELYQGLLESKQCSEVAHNQNSYSEQEILFALENEQFLGYMQPKVCCSTEEIIGIEVLARWLHPTDGLISPYFFVNKLEKLGKSQDLSSLLLKQTSLFWKNNKAQLSSIQISINISTTELLDVSLPEKLYEICVTNEMPTNLVTLELTESNIIKNIKQSLDVLLRLKLKGFKLSIDDFGTGYSSMKQLNELPFDELKIDRCFVDGCSTDPSKKIIVASTCEMANKLGLEVVAEGVEQEDDLIIVRELGVKSIQGFYYFKPCSSDEFIRLINPVSSIRGLTAIKST